MIKEEYRTVIHCPEKWQAETLIEELKQIFHVNVYGSAARWWVRYEDETCYWTKIRTNPFNDSVDLEYCDIGWFEEQDFRILEFDDVYFALVDYGEFSSEEIDVLFGGI